MSKSPSYMKNEATKIVVKPRSGAIFLVLSRVSGGVSRWEAWNELEISEALHLGRTLIEQAHKAAALQAAFDNLDAPREIA